VLRRLEPQQAPALGVPERLPARVEWLCGGELVLAPDVPEVTAEPPVAQTGADVCMASDEPALEPLLVEQRRLLSQRGKRRIGVGQKGGTGGIETAQVAATIVIPPRAFCRSVTRTFSGGSSSACAASSRMCTASASQNAPSFRKLAR
jgi:hypothetical protein